MIPIVFVLLVVWLTLQLVLRSQPIAEPFMISHRGAAAYAPENTLTGVSEAVNRGVQFVEIDVQRSADGVLVVMHDRTVDRTTNGTGEIRELTWEELRALDAGEHFAQEFTGEPIPTLESVLELVARARINLVLEAKNPRLYPGMEHQIADHLQRFDLEDHVIVVSFDHDWLDRFHQIAPAVSLGKLYVWAGSLQKAREADFVDVHWLSVILDPTLVRRAHHRGYQVAVWTVNSVWCVKLLLWLGVDGITTDRPDLGSEVTG